MQKHLQRKIVLTVNKKKIYRCQLITSDKIMLIDCCSVVLYCFNLTLTIHYTIYNDNFCINIHYKHNATL